MRTAQRRTLWAITLILGSVFTLTDVPEVTASKLRAEVEEAVRDMGIAAGKQVQVTRSPVTGLVIFLAAAEGFPIPTGIDPSAPSLEHALTFLQRFGAAFGLKREDIQLVEVSGPDEVGMRYVRLQQIHDGLPVMPGELTVHLRGAAVTAVLARTLPDLENFSTVPTVSAAEALEEAKNVRPHGKREKLTDASLSVPQLVIYHRALLEERAGRRPTLAWFIEARKPDVRELIVVDALRGKVLLHFNQLEAALQRTVYDAKSTASLPGTLCRVEGGAPSANSDCNFAYTYAGDTYNYFLTQHGRDSYDDAGAPLISTVDYCPSANQCPYQNSYWDGEQMVYGQGFPVADDVDAHELTHAVTQYSANLIYYKQSGALDESFSDIFGETIDLTNSGGTDTAAVRWLLGEDIPGIGAIRNMIDPTAFGDPGKVSDRQYQCSSVIDSGGVHTNSGVPNHAYALMVDGGSYNGFTITGIGLTKAGKIQYRALTRYLVSGSKFLDDYLALQQSCTDLTGTADISASDCAAVKKALDAVQMSKTPCK
jgi:bacillolysin